MDDGRKVITIAHPEQSSGELKPHPPPLPPPPPQKKKNHLSTTEISTFTIILQIFHEKQFAKEK